MFRQQFVKFSCIIHVCPVAKHQFIGPSIFVSGAIAPISSRAHILTVAHSTAVCTCRHPGKKPALSHTVIFFSSTDSLEVGNSKKALQEAEKVLRKNPDIQCARALKALALIRIGREDEAQGLIESVAKEKPCDDPTLYVMTFCYKEQEQC